MICGTVWESDNRLIEFRIRDCESFGISVSKMSRVFGKCVIVLEIPIGTNAKWGHYESLAMQYVGNGFSNKK